MLTLVWHKATYVGKMVSNSLHYSTMSSLSAYCVLISLMQSYSSGVLSENWTLDKINLQDKIVHFASTADDLFYFTKIFLIVTKFMSVSVGMPTFIRIPLRKAMCEGKFLFILMIAPLTSLTLNASSVLDSLSSYKNISAIIESLSDIKTWIVSTVSIE